MTKVLLALALVVALGGCSFLAAAARSQDHGGALQECPGVGAPLADVGGALAFLSFAAFTTTALRSEGGVPTGLQVGLYSIPLVYTASALYGGNAHVRCVEPTRRH